MGDYPEKPIRIIVPGALGGPGHTIAHAVADGISPALGQSVEVVSARSQIGGLFDAARAAPDGYTFVMGGGSSYIAAALYKTLPYDPYDDFAAVNLAAGIANVLVVHPSLPVRTMQELIDYAKANRGKLKYGSSGYGGPPHIAAANFARLAGIEMIHVPYKGHVLAGKDLVAGKLDVMFDAVPTAAEHVSHDELRALAVTTSHRIPAMPDLPTIAEEGLAGYDLNPAMGVLAPAGTPDAILEKVAVEIGKAMAKPEVKIKLDPLGIEPIVSTREHFTSFRAVQFKKWANALKEAGIEPVDAPVIE